MQGRVMLITGATSGIGRATALHCAGLGARVVAGARSEERGQALIEEIKSAGGEATFVAADVRSDADVKSLVDAALAKYDGLDYAFNNAGTFGPEPLWHEYDDAHWDEVIGINLTGVYRCMKYELPLCARAQWQTVVPGRSSTTPPLSAIAAAGNRAQRTRRPNMA